MDWETISKIITLLSALIMVVGALWKLSRIASSVASEMEKLSSTMQSFSENLQRVEREFKEQIKRNSEKHKDIWQHNDEQDEKIAANEKTLINHEQRIKNLEEDSKRQFTAKF